MTSDQMPVSAPTNRQAIASFCAGLLAILALCTALAPIPFTGYLCFPAAVVLGMAAILDGLRARRKFQVLGGRGKALATAGLGMGSAAFLATLCSGLVAVALAVRIAESVRHLLP